MLSILHTSPVKPFTTHLAASADSDDTWFHATGDDFSLVAKLDFSGIDQPLFRVHSSTDGEAPETMHAICKAWLADYQTAITKDAANPIETFSWVLNPRFEPPEFLALLDTEGHAIGVVCTMNFLTWLQHDDGEIHDDYGIPSLFARARQFLYDFDQ